MSIPTTLAAETGNENIVTVEGDINDEKIIEQVEELLSDPDVDGVSVIDPNLIIYPNDSLIQPRAGWKVTAACAFPWEQIGDRRLAVASGSSGRTLKISQTQSVSVTNSGTFGASYAMINASVGYSITSAETLNITGSAVVPNGKNMRLVAYPIEQVTVYTVSYNNVKKGSGQARRPVGIHFAKEYY